MILFIKSQVRYLIVYILTVDCTINWKVNSLSNLMLLTVTFVNIHEGHALTKCFRWHWVAGLNIFWYKEWCSIAMYYIIGRKTTRPKSPLNASFCGFQSFISSECDKSSFVHTLGNIPLRFYDSLHCMT